MMNETTRRPRGGVRVWFTAVGLVLAAGTFARGQEAAPAPGQEAGDPAALEAILDTGAQTNALATRMPLEQIVQSGGWPMWVLGAMSVAGFALALYFLIVLRAGQLMPERFLREVQDLLRSGRLQEAREACRDRRCAAAAIARSAIDYALHTERPDPGMVKEIIEGEGGRQASLLRDQVQYLHDIAVIAPMVGLLGTVFGMLQAFSAVALDVTKVKPMFLAGGVAQALITTAAGLLVGIPAMMAFAFFRGRTSRLIAGLEAAAADMLTSLVQGRTR